MKVWHRRRRNPGPEERGQGLCGVVVLEAGFGALEAVHWSKERQPGFPAAFQLTSAHSPLLQLRPRRRSMARWFWALLLGRPSLEHLLQAEFPRRDAGGLRLDEVTLDVVTRCSLSFKV